MDTLKAILVFVKVAKYQSFTKTAQDLNLSKATVSRYIEHLETVFKVRLLQRNTRKVSLTTAGEQALTHCYSILHQQQELLGLSDEHKIQGCIRLTMSAFLFEIYFKKILIEYRTRYPQVHFDLLMTEDIVDVYDQRVDLAFRVSSKFVEGLIAYPLVKIDSVLCASAEYLAQHDTLVRPQQLDQFDCIAHQAIAKNGTWALTYQQQPQNYNIQVSHSSNEVMVLHQLCHAHQGIAMLPSALVREDLESGRLIQVLSEYQAPEFELCMVYSSRRHVPKTLQSFIAFLKQYF